MVYYKLTWAPSTALFYKLKVSSRVTRMVAIVTVEDFHFTHVLRENLCQQYNVSVYVWFLSVLLYIGSEPAA